MKSGMNRTATSSGQSTAFPLIPASPPKRCRNGPPAISSNSQSKPLKRSEASDRTRGSPFAHQNSTASICANLENWGSAKSSTFWRATPMTPRHKPSTKHITIRSGQSSARRKCGWEKAEAFQRVIRPPLRSVDFSPQRNCPRQSTTPDV